MRRMFFLAGLVAYLWSCGDDRPAKAGAGNTDGAPANSVPGTANGANTYEGGSTADPMTGNVRGQATDSAGNGALNAQPTTPAGDSGKSNPSATSGSRRNQ